MEKQKAIEILEKQRFEINGLKKLSNTSSSPEFTKWHRDTQIAIQKIFSEDSRHINDFIDISYRLNIFSSDTPDSKFNKAYINGLDKASSILSSFIDEINNYWNDDIKLITSSISPIEKVELLCNRFHNVVLQLRYRHADRTTIEIKDEYDVQNLFHSLLTLYFDDIRNEEWTPSYAGACARVDFLLKQEQIIIELKKTRKSLTGKVVGEELIIDTQRYSAHPDCKNLICFVYDPDALIKNPRGLENDLTKMIDGLNVKVIIRP
jgi:dGTP triphosphohydrolase